MHFNYRDQLLAKKFNAVAAYRLGCVRERDCNLKIKAYGLRFEDLGAARLDDGRSTSIAQISAHNGPAPKC